MGASKVLHSRLNSTAYHKRLGARLPKHLEQAPDVRIVAVVQPSLRTDFGIEKYDVPSNSNALKENLKKIFETLGLDFMEILEFLTEFGAPLNLKEDDNALDEAFSKVLQKISSQWRNRSGIRRGQRFQR